MRDIPDLNTKGIEDKQVAHINVEGVPKATARLFDLNPRVIKSDILMSLSSMCFFIDIKKILEFLMIMNCLAILLFSL